MSEANLAHVRDVSSAARAYDLLVPPVAGLAVNARLQRSLGQHGSRRGMCQPGRTVTVPRGRVCRDGAVRRIRSLYAPPVRATDLARTRLRDARRARKRMQPDPHARRIGDEAIVQTPHGADARVVEPWVQVDPTPARLVAGAACRARRRRAGRRGRGANTEGEAAAVMSRSRIVLVDDHLAVQEGLTFFLGDAYDLIVHAHAADAVAVIRQAQPALALIDLHLEYPAAGLDVVRALRAEAATAGLPLIVWSTDPTVQQQVAALGLPNVAVVSKYDDLAWLQAAIAQATAAVDDRDDPAATRAIPC